MAVLCEDDTPLSSSLGLWPHETRRVKDYDVIQITENLPSVFMEGDEEPLKKITKRLTMGVAGSSACCDLGWSVESAEHGYLYQGTINFTLAKNIDPHLVIESFQNRLEMDGRDQTAGSKRRKKQIKKEKTRCEECNVTYAHKSGLSRHRMTKHSNKIFSCKNCARCFSRSDNLSDHNARFHM